MVNLIPLVQITDVNYRKAYSKLTKMLRYTEESGLVKHVFGPFNPKSTIGFFNRHRYFSDKQIKYINSAYKRLERIIERHKLVSNRYAQEGYEDSLIQLMERFRDCLHTDGGKRKKGFIGSVVSGLRKGQHFYTYCFQVMENNRHLIPEEQRDQFDKELSVLKNKYLEMSSPNS
ncbi:hypothetical protein J4221_02460 [Candidatus Pacearchaeota archaeon]|nr:hypothetical protein [Candidatus Pacearchaeota archaeon]